MADAGDSKSPAPCGRVGSTPTSGTSYRERRPQRLAVVASRLPLERVRELEKKLPGDGDELVVVRLDPRRKLRGQDARLPVSDEQHRLPVELVAEQKGAVEAALLCGHGEAVQGRVALRLDVLPDETDERPRREGVGHLEARNDRGEETLLPSIRVDVEPSPVRVDVELQMVLRPERSHDAEIAAFSRPHVLEVDLVPEESEESDARDAPRGIDLHRVLDLLPVEEDIGEADRVGHVGDEPGEVATSLEIDLGNEAARQERPVAILDVVLADRGGDEVPEPLREEVPPEGRRGLPVADLRHEPVIGAELVAEVAIVDPPEGRRSGVTPAGVERAPGKVPAVPLGGELGTIRSRRLRPEELTRNLVLPVRRPLEVRAGDAVVPAPLDLAVGEEEPGERSAEVAAHPRDPEV